MSRRDSVIMDIDLEDDELDPDEELDHILEHQELEDFEGTDINESEFMERL